MNTLSRFKFYLWYFGFFKVAMIGYLRPKLIKLDDKDIIVRIPLTKKSRNHLDSMYFGALAVGADIAGGLHGFYFANKLGLNISLVFKSFEAHFHKRPERDVYFVSSMGQEIHNMIMESKRTRLRINKPIAVKAFTDLNEEEPVADFSLELSVKVSSSH